MCDSDCSVVQTRFAPCLIRSLITLLRSFTVPKLSGFCLLETRWPGVGGGEPHNSSVRLKPDLRESGGGDRVSLTMIVRDERENLPRCLESVRGVFDEIVVLDTGSKDRTGKLRGGARDGLVGASGEARKKGQAFPHGRPGFRGSARGSRAERCRSANAYGERKTGECTKRNQGVGASARPAPHPAFGHPLPASGARDQAVTVDSEMADAGAATRETLFLRERVTGGGRLIPEMVYSLALLASPSQKNQRKSQRDRTPSATMILIVYLGLF